MITDLVIDRSLNAWMIEGGAKTLHHQCHGPMPEHDGPGCLCIYMIDKWVCTNCIAAAPQEIADVALLAECPTHHSLAHLENWGRGHVSRMILLNLILLNEKMEKLLNG